MKLLKKSISDEVRAPIPQKQEVLIQPGYEGYALSRSNARTSRVRSVFDGFRNFSNEARKLNNFSCEIDKYVKN